MKAPKFIWLLLLLVQAMSGSAGTVFTVDGIAGLPRDLTNVTAMTACSSKFLAVRNDQTVFQWGTYNGQGGVPPGLSNVVGVACSFEENFAWRSDGSVVGWGLEYHGQTNVPGGLTDVVAVAAGAHGICALRAGGQIILWGADDPFWGATNVPDGLDDVIAIAAESHTLALQADGKVVTWGFTSVPVPRFLDDAIAIGTAGYNNAALRRNGTVVVWGGDGLNTPFYTNVIAEVSNVVAISQTFGKVLILRADGTAEAFLPAQNSYDHYHIFPIDGLTNTVAVAAGYPDLFLLGDGAPSFVRQPVARARVFTGRDYTLQVLAAGNAPLTYQWRWNGMEIPDATNSSLTFTDIQMIYAGSYTVVVSNNLGVAVSQAVRLSVTDSPPLVRVPPLEQSFAPGGSVFLEVEADGSGPFSYQWRFNGAAIAGATDSTLVISNGLRNDAGLYSVLIANSFGSLASAPAAVSVSFEYDFNSVHGPLLWNLSGGYAAITGVFPDWDADLHQTASGRITDGLSEHVGGIRGSSSKVSVNLVHHDVYEESGISWFEEIDVYRTDRLQLTLDRDGSLNGNDRLSETRKDIYSFIFTRVKNLGTTVSLNPVSVGLPAGADGSWKLKLNLLPKDKKVSGRAFIDFPNGDTYRFNITGSYSPQTLKSKLLLTGADQDKGAHLMLSLSGSEMNMDVLAGTVAGQQLRFP